MTTTAGTLETAGTGSACPASWYRTGMASVRFKQAYNITGHHRTSPGMASVRFKRALQAVVSSVRLKERRVLG